jgi:hypothetical protein
VVHPQVRVLRWLAHRLAPDWDIVTSTVPGDALDVLRQTQVHAVLAYQGGAEPRGGLWLLKRVQRAHPGVVRILTAEGWLAPFEVYRCAGVFDGFIELGTSVRRLLGVVLAEAPLG